MKKSIFLSTVIFLLSISFINAQIVNIPDINFEQALIDLGIDTGPTDGSVLEANIIDITFLDVSGKNINSLEGIASFINLESLICSDNNLQILDISNNVNLRSLLCGINQLTSLDIRSNISLEVLDCSSNQIAELILQEGNVAGNPSLERLTCSNNRLTNIDVSENANLTFLSISSNQIAGELLVGNNTNLENLFCASNKITNLNLSINTVIKNIDVSNNLISTLDLSTINTLVCPDPQTDPITICQGTGSINVSSNQLVSLNIANGFNDLITSFNSEDNPDLFCIQVDAGFTPNTYWEKDDWTYYGQMACTDIFTYVPDDNFEAYLETQGLGDGIANNNFVLKSSIINQTILDVSNNNIEDLTGIEDFDNLERLYCSNNNIKSLDLNNNTLLLELNCSNNTLPSLDLSSNTALTILNCSSQTPYVDPDDASNNYSFTSLNINSNGNLLNLDCSGNALSILDISNNLSLTDLNCSDNTIKSLNVSNLTTLTDFNCASNTLEVLNISNGTNGTLANFNAVNNADLYCIQADNNTVPVGVTWAIGGATLAVNCGIYVPDDAFENYLENLVPSLGDGIANNNYVSANVAAFAGALNIANLGIIDLTGIEAFTVLTELDCSDNNLTHIDLSNNTALTTLDCSSNQIENLDLSLNTNLTSIYCDDNALFTLNIKNGNNNNLNPLDARNNSNLFCINVDDAIEGTTPNGWDIDATTSYYGDCDNDRYTLIPDDNFEQALVDLGIDNILGDNRVLNSSIEHLSVLNVSNKQIENLEGIKGFMLLQELDCSNNYLNDLDLSDMIYLESLYCGSNYFLTNDETSANGGILNIVGTDNLIQLFCADNNLIDLNVSNNANLEELDCSNNKLTILDISTNNNLIEVNCNSNQISNLLVNEATNNNTLTALSCNANEIGSLALNRYIALTTLNCRSNNLMTLDITSNTDLEIIDFSDNDLTDIDFSGKSNLIAVSGSQNQLTEVNDLTSASLESLILNNNEIIEFTTLNSLAGLKYLSANSNQLSNNLDISSNIYLIELNVSDNTLTSIQLPANLNQLKTFNCSNNQITGDFDLSTMGLGACPIQNTDNPLDFCPDTISINISNNQLEFVNIKNGFNNDISNFNATNNPDLFCIQVDDDTNIGANWFKDSTSTYSIDCRFGETYVPDDNFEQALITMGYDVGPLDDYVPTAAIEVLTELDISGNNISDLTGIEDFEDLQNLNCSNNNLNVIDISNNSNLTTINCSNNALEILDLANNLNVINVNIANNVFTAFDVSLISTLQVFNCDGNTIVELDFTTNTSINTISCASNSLEILNLQNGQNPSILNLDAQNNPDLSCIQTDDGNAPGGVTWLKDATTQYAVNCYFGETYVPDDNFEQALIDLGYDTAPLDDYVSTANIENRSSLNIVGKEIVDLTGIEDFKGLTSLNFENNLVATVDLSNNLQLISLNASVNQLTGLDIANQSNLRVLNISENNITQIDLSNNLGITELNISDNEFTTLNVNLLPDLAKLNCSSNQLTELDVTLNPNLVELFCLSNLFFQDNLNIQNGTNEILDTFNASNNPDLSCILVDNPVAVISNTAGTYDNWYKDSTANYQTVCDDADNDGIANEDDLCPGTPFGTSVDLFGCAILNLPNNNFTILVTDETCLNVNNGKINISTEEYYNYQATLVGDNLSRVYDFTNDIDILNLLAGTYELCLTIQELPNYISCYTIVIKHPEGLDVLTNKIDNGKALSLELSGSSKYNINFNGLAFSTNKSELTLQLKDGSNTIKVSTDAACQGVYEESILVSDEVYVYPNPFHDNINISLGNTLDEFSVAIYSYLGQLVHFKNYNPSNSNNLDIDTSDLAIGFYTVSVQTKKSLLTFKIVKK